MRLPTPSPSYGEHTSWVSLFCAAMIGEGPRSLARESLAGPGEVALLTDASSLLFSPPPSCVKAAIP